MGSLKSRDGRLLEMKKDEKQMERRLGRAAQSGQKSRERTKWHDEIRNGTGGYGSRGGMGNKTAERQSTGTGRDTYRIDKSRGEYDDKDNNKNM